jgi:DNA-binding transcriptional LysR family regulator
MDRFAAMHAFARVAETGSFSAAARQLRQSKSLISRQVADLEASLGVRLIQRTTRSLSLTEAGAAYYVKAQRILAELEEAELAAAQSQANPRGRLRLAAPMSFSILHLAPVLPDFLARYTEIDIAIEMNDRVVDLLEEGFDLALRIGRLSDSRLIARKLAPMRRVIAASPDYLARFGRPAKPQDLKQHACLCYSNRGMAEEWRFIGQNIEVKGRVHANNGDLLREMALNGLGIVDLPLFLIEDDLHSGALVTLLEDFLKQDAGLYAVYPKAPYLAPKVRVLIDFLAARWQGDSPWHRPIAD